jgi:hypothetical protein
MNKTKRVASHKHRIKAKKYALKRKATQKASGVPATSTARR